MPIVYDAGTLEPVKDHKEAVLTGVRIPHVCEQTLEVALALHPETTDVFVISDTAARDTLMEREASPQQARLGDRVRVTCLTDVPLDQLMATVKTLPETSLILYISHSQQEEGKVLEQSDVLSLVSHSASVPVYSPWRALIGYGTVGGYVEDPLAGAANAAERDRRAAGAAHPEDAPADRRPRVPMFDARQLKRWGIHEAQLPPGSIVLYREPTMWDPFKVYISVAMALGVQTTLMAGLLVQWRRRRRAEALVNRTEQRPGREQRYELATTTGEVSVWVWNLSTNEVYVDASFKRLLGYEDQEIPNRFDSWVRLLHPEDALHVLDALHAHVEGRTPRFDSEHRMLHKDGPYRWFVTHGQAIRQPNGTALRVVGTVTDIRCLKATEEKLAEAQRQLSRVSRINALGEFAASMAHELAQPLSTILLNSRVALTCLDHPAPDIAGLRSALADIAEAGERANEVVRRNRDLFRRHTVDRQVLDVATIVSDVAQLVRTRLAEREIQLETRITENLTAVVGDRVQLQQVLLNLFANAMDAMEGVDPRRRKLQVEARLADPAFVCISVRDTGIGLAGVDVDRMFMPFYTTKPSGTGVGLSISRAIVEAHGGRIWAEANADAGAVISFTVPTVASAAVSTAGTTPSPS